MEVNNKTKIVFSIQKRIEKIVTKHAQTKFVNAYISDLKWALNMNEVLVRTNFRHIGKI